jgi:hypothetical protein
VLDQHRLAFTLNYDLLTYRALRTPALTGASFVVADREPTLRPV